MNPDRRKYADTWNAIGLIFNVSPSPARSRRQRALYLLPFARVRPAACFLPPAPYTTLAMANSVLTFTTPFQFPDPLFN